MKTILPLLLLGFISPVSAQITASSYATQPATLLGGSYTLHYGVFWTCNDFPVTSTPARVELVDSGGFVVGWSEGHVTQFGATASTNLGTASVLNSDMLRMSPDLTVADGSLSALWQIPALPAGNYTLRFWDYETQPGWVPQAAVWTHTYFQAGVAAPPPAVKYALNTSATAGGSVTPGGLYDAGTSVSLSASPQPGWNFVGWKGDVSGVGNPISVLMDRDRSVHAIFAPQMVTLTTTATAGGSVSPGGTYPYGTLVSINANANLGYRFTGWSGDVTGGSPSVTVTLNGPLTVFANFAAKLSQSISFPAPGNQSVGANLALIASATSGLPVSYTVVSGPATWSAGVLTLTGAGTVTVEASQPGDDLFLPAAPVQQTFSAITYASLRYEPSARTLLQDGSPFNYVLTTLP